MNDQGQYEDKEDNMGSKKERGGILPKKYITKNFQKAS